MNEVTIASPRAWCVLTNLIIIDNDAGFNMDGERISFMEFLERSGQCTCGSIKLSGGNALLMKIEKDMYPSREGKR